jgi:hypothetical protein
MMVGAVSHGCLVYLFVGVMHLGFLGVCYATACMFIIRFLMNSL